MNLIEFGAIQNNKMIITNRIGITKPPEFHLHGSRGCKHSNGFLHNIIQYNGLTSEDKYVYALYINVPIGDIFDNEHTTHIEVYSWDGNPVALLKLDKNISHLVVDEEMQTIYGFNYDISEDFLHAFKYHIEE